MKAPLSVVILARNEAINIETCVRAVSWCDDVVVIDDASTDGTDGLAKVAGARVIQHPFSSFADQRNWAMEHAGLRHEWILHLDADEVVTESLQRRIEESLSATSADTVAFRMCRKTMFQGCWLKYSDGFPVWIMRLVRRGRVRFVDCGHGELAVPPVVGNLGTITEPFLHFSFSKGLEDWIARHNRYSTREALLEHQSFQRVKWGELLSSDRANRRNALRTLSRRLPFRSLLRFLYQYILKRGFLDGSAGYTFCRLMGTYEGWIVLKRKELERSSLRTMK